MQLLYELDSYSVEKHYLLPAIDKLRERIKLKNKVGITHFVRYVKLLLGTIQLGSGTEGDKTYVSSITFQNANTLHLHEFILRNSMTVSPDEELRLWDRSLIPTLREECNEAGVVDIGSLRTTSPFIKSLAQSDGA